MDSFCDPIPWKHRLLTVQLSSGASRYKRGGMLQLPAGNLAFGVYRPASVRVMENICFKEALALYFVSQFSVRDAVGQAGRHSRGLAKFA